MTKPLYILLLLAFLAGGAGCAREEREQHIWHPLVVKYLHDSGRRMVVSSGNDTYIEDWTKNPAERTKIDWDQESWTPRTCWSIGCSDYHTELAQILKESGVVISNAIVANDIRNLVDVVARVNVCPEHLVESITHYQNVWSLESRYYGGPDDRHRRPSKIVMKLYTDEVGLITNIVKDIYPRPSDYEDVIIYGIKDKKPVIEDERVRIKELVGKLTGAGFSTNATIVMFRDQMLDVPEIICLNLNNYSPHEYIEDIMGALTEGGFYKITFVHIHKSKQDPADQLTPPDGE